MSTDTNPTQFDEAVDWAIWQTVAEILDLVRDQHWSVEDGATFRGSLTAALDKRSNPRHPRPLFRNTDTEEIPS